MTERCIKEVLIVESGRWSFWYNANWTPWGVFFWLGNWDVHLKLTHSCYHTINFKLYMYTRMCKYVCVFKINFNVLSCRDHKGLWQVVLVGSPEIFHLMGSLLFIPFKISFFISSLILKLFVEILYKVVEILCIWYTIIRSFSYYIFSLQVIYKLVQERIIFFPFSFAHSFISQIFSNIRLGSFTLFVFPYLPITGLRTQSIHCKYWLTEKHAIMRPSSLKFASFFS